MPFPALSKVSSQVLKSAFISAIAILLSSCTLLLLNGHLSRGYYEAKSETFRCKLPGGALSSKVEIMDHNNDLGETATFSLNIGLLWRIDHLRISKHKLAMIDNANSTLEYKRVQLDQAKDNYMSFYLAQNVDHVEVEWEQFIVIDDKEVLLTSTYVKWDDQEEKREVLFSIDGDYLNVVHFSQNMSSDLQKFTTGAAGFYKSCDFY